MTTPRLNPSYNTSQPSLFRPDDRDYELLIAEKPLSLFQASPLSSVYLTLLTYWTALRVTVAHLINYETIFVAMVSAGSVVFYTFVKPQNGDPLVAPLSLSFLFFALVFSVQSLINFTFQRREKALGHLAAIKLYVFHIYVAHRDWAFTAEGKRCAYSGRNILNVRVPENAGGVGDSDTTNNNSDKSSSDDSWDVWGGAVSQQHTEEVRFVLIKMIRAMRDYLALPLANRSRHMYTAPGRRVRKAVRPVQHDCLQDFYEQMQRLTLAVERMKEAGFPGNEAARVNQYHTLLMKEWEHARFIKSYRTPTGLRAFARVYILVHPVFAGPYYAWVAGAGKQEEDGWPFQASLGFAIALAIFTAITLQGLFNVEVGMEDPYDDNEGLDNVRVKKLFLEMERIICMEWAPQVWNDTVMRGMSIVDAPLHPVLGKVPKDVPRPGLKEAQEAIERDLNPLSRRMRSR